MFGKPSPPHLPFDILTTISHISIPAYRGLLALSRFGRSSLTQQHQFLHQSYFIVCSIKKDEYGFIIHKWHLIDSLSKRRILHSPLSLDGTVGPAVIIYHPPISRCPVGQKYCEEWYYHNELHSPLLPDGIVGPASISYLPPLSSGSNNQKEYECWYHKGRRHSPRLPDGTLGPAYISYTKNGQIAAQEWYRHGRLHHTDGPACVYTHGSDEYWVNGKKITEKRFPDDLA
jgi:hypothetical protein